MGRFFLLFTFFALSFSLTAQNCQNAIFGGSVAGEQTICAGTIPFPITNVSDPIGGVGNFEYLWISWDVEPASAPDDFEIVPNSNTAGLDIPALNHTMWFRRCARRTGCIDYVAETNIIKITVTPAIVEAKCKDVAVELTNGQAVISPAMVDDGSISSCGSLDFMTLTEDTFTESGVFPVNLLVETAGGQSAACAAQITVTEPTPVCENITDGGQITGVSSICLGESAGTINSYAPASGGSGIMEYRWLRSTNGADFNVISNENDADLVIGTIFQSGFYKREAKRDGCADYISSNVLQINVNPFDTYQLQNTASCTIELFVVKPNGDEELIQTIQAGATIGQQSYFNDMWRVRNASTQELLKEFTVSGCAPADILIDDCGTILPPTGCDGNGGETYSLDIKLDNYPGETSWYIKNDAGTKVANGGPYSNRPKNSELTETICLPQGCYTLYVKDSYGDGICCRYGNGFYKLKNEDGLVMVQGGEFGRWDIRNFCLDGTPCDNFTSGGAIGKDCRNDQLVLTDATSPAGGSGDMEIVWLRSTINCDFSTMEEIPNTNNALSISLDPVNQTTYFVRCSRRNACLSMNDFKESNCLTVYPGDCGTAPSTCSNKNVLFVVGNTNLGSGDNWIKSRLQQLGLNVQLKDDDVIQSSDANGKALVLLSSTVLSGKVGNKFTNSAVPVITWESWLYDNLKMTGTSAGADFGSMNTQAVNIAQPNHPLAAGLSGSFNVYPHSKPARCGQPTNDAIKVVRFYNAASEWGIFAYDAGASMYGGFTAPARRVALFLDDNTASYLYSKGRKLFDASIRWAMDCADLPDLNSVIEAPTLTFSATKKDKQVELLWTNNTGELNDYFEVQHSTDGANFTALEEVDGAGPEGDILYFRTYDERPTEGVNYYRLKWVLNNGEITYSTVQRIEFLTVRSFTAYPNPARSFTMIDLSAWTGEDVQIELVNLQGKAVQSLNVVASEDAARLDLSAHEPSQYIVRLISKNQRPETKKLVIIE